MGDQPALAERGRRAAAAPARRRPPRRRAARCSPPRPAARHPSPWSRPRSCSARWPAAQQAQNIEWRFQAPIHVLPHARRDATRRRACRAGRPRLAARLWRGLAGPGAAPTSPARCSPSAPPLPALPALRPALVAGKTLFPRDYMDSFAVRAGPALDDAVIVLTEAGRLPFWTAGTAFDMVGLNFAPTARRPPSLESIAASGSRMSCSSTRPARSTTRACWLSEPERGAVNRVDPRNQRVVQIDPRTLTAALKAGLPRAGSVAPRRLRRGDPAREDGVGDPRRLPGRSPRRLPRLRAPVRLRARAHPGGPRRAPRGRRLRAARRRRPGARATRPTAMRGAGSAVPPAPCRRASRRCGVADRVRAAGDGSRAAARSELDAVPGDSAA